MKHFFRLIAFVWVNVMWPVMAAEIREFTDTTGRKIRAELLGLDDNKVLLRTDAGAKLTLDLGKFSAADREYISNHGKPAAASQKKIESLDDAVAAIDEAVVLGIFRGDDALRKAHARDAAWKIKEGVPVTPYKPLTPNAPLTEEQFVRRAYLDIAGRIPTAAEVSAFLDDATVSKRARLIDQLLSSDEFASHLYNYLADMLRIKPETEYSEVRNMKHGEWLKQQLQQNRPYDEIVRDVLTAKGKPWEGAAGFYLRDIGMPLEHVTHVMWTFLGTDISCAQCHDHPFNDWTQRQFYETAAFFRSVRMERARTPASSRGASLVEEAVQLAAVTGGNPRRVRNIAQQAIQTNRWMVWDDAARPLLLPADYKYRDGVPGETVEPKLIRWSADDDRNAAWKEAEASLQKNVGATRREIFAKWVTHPSNPRFAMVMAHRLWTRAFGPSLTAGYGSGVPILMGKLGDPRDCSNPELLDLLAREMVRVKFDLRAFMRTICNTQAWQRAATVEEVLRGQPYYFQGPMLRRMTAEQLWDSMVTLAVGRVPVTKLQPSELNAQVIDLDLENPKFDAKTLLLKLAARQALEAKPRGKRPPPNRATPVRSYAGLALMRASDLNQPAPLDHALRTFGQSERELMDSNTLDGSVPQVLALMHGKISGMVTSPESQVLRTRAKGADGVKSIYLSVLGRKPTDKEQTRAEQHLGEAGEAGWADLVWALVNSREFLFVQ